MPWYLPSFHQLYLVPVISPVIYIDCILICLLFQVFAGIFLTFSEAAINGTHANDDVHRWCFPVLQNHMNHMTMFSHMFESFAAIIVHWKIFSSVWDILWLCSWFRWPKTVLALVTLVRLSPVCATPMWIFNWPVEILEKLQMQVFLQSCSLNEWLSALCTVYYQKRMICCIAHTCVSSLQNGWACDYSEFQLGQMFSCIGHIWKDSLHCYGSSHGPQALGFCCLSYTWSPCHGGNVTVSYKGCSKSSTLEFSRCNQKLWLCYSLVRLVWQNTEELISRPFTGLYKIRLLLRDRMRTKNLRN